MQALRLFHAAYLRFAEDDGPAYAGYIAFSGLLALFPFVIVMVNLAALAFGAGEGAAALEAIFDLAPEHVARTLEPVVRDVLSGSGGGVLTVSLLVAIYVASNGFEALRKAFDRAYETRAPRHWLAGRLVSILCVLLGAAFGLAFGLLIPFGPLAIRALEAAFGITLPFAAGLLRYGLGLTAFAAFAALLHRALPRPAPGRRIWPGVLVSTVLWALAASLFSLYLAYSASYVTTYGALAGVAITLMFLYLTGMAIIYGAEVNAALAAEDRT